MKYDGAAEKPSVQTDAAYVDGIYKGAATGYNGRLKVAVTIEGGRIADISLKSHVEDEPYITRATEGMFSRMIEYNTPYVDTVSSATTTSEAFIAAVEDALSEAVEGDGSTS